MPYTDPKTNKILDQRSMRRDRNMRDQYGRLYLTSLELTQEGPQPTEIVTAGWTDPLRALNSGRKFFQIVKQEFGEIDPSRIHLDEKGWFDEVKRAEREWMTSYYQWGRRHYKDGFDPSAEPTEFLLSLTGPKPFPSVALLRRAFGLDAEGRPAPGAKPDPALLGQAPLTAEHRRLLGIPEPDDLLDPGEPPATPDDVVNAGPPDKYQPFIAWAMQHGMDWEQARAAWADHKAALQGQEA